MRVFVPGLLLASVLACALSACGGGGGSSGSAGNALSGASTIPVSGGGGAGALSAEARSQATGDIPDTQVFLSFHNQQAGYSMLYPEGWAQRGSGADVTFQDKNNIVHILIARAPAPTSGSVTAELARERRGRPSLTYGSPSIVSILRAPVVKISYSTLSAPNPVTGKRVQLLVDRYVYARSGKVAIVDLGTAKGVDNVDAYKMMSRSFRWQ